ncbi:glycosyltransferase family 2 protein [Pectobacterium punjabense]|uniref:glycosyltransferase family 2 protein n=1 Tax=Pectobacterium punjabense TaxID=2108399 RepID=UPI002B24637D|nr:glycosyltransferase [Pectobacterium punjabense]
MTYPVHTPLVSVIMPIYNVAEYVHSAIESIINQTYKNIELIIINDGSTDDSDSIIKQFLHDTRIKYLSRENKGLISTLNEGIAHAQGEFIARMDGDDISHPERIKKQVEFLLKNEDIAVLGTASVIINSESDKIGERNPPSSPFFNKALMIFGPTVTHPSVMIRRSLVGSELYYNPNSFYVEDYELWLRLSKKVKIANLSEKLFYYRINTNGISITHAIDQKNNAAFAYMDVIHSGVNDKNLLNHLKVIHQKDSDKKIKRALSLLFVLANYELDRYVFIKIGYIIRWFLK